MYNCSLQESRTMMIGQDFTEVDIIKGISLQICQIGSLCSKYKISRENFPSHKSVNAHPEKTCEEIVL